MNDLPNSDFAIIVVREALRGVWTKIEKNGWCKVICG